MNATVILVIFLCLRLLRHVAEATLAKLNREYYLNDAHQRHARQVLGISAEDMQKTLLYSEDKYRFGTISGWINLVVVLVFIAAGGLGVAEHLAQVTATRWGAGPVVIGLLFFAVLTFLGMLLNLPFDYYRTFVIEQKLGFNRQTPKGFWLDRLKGLVIAALLGAPILALILWIMQAMGSLWWVYAWVALSVFSLLTAWIYPTFLAPLFNKFTAVESGELLDKVNALADKIGFRTAGIYVMDASKRSSHGNAYFTGVFGKKRIVLFDTLVQSMGVSEVVAVLAHELGHFKLHHVRTALFRGILMTAVTFYLLSLCLPLETFYHAFALSGVTNYGALIVFGMWFGIVDFFLQPFENWLSRRNEFAADRFAKQYTVGSDLSSALLKLRETSHAMPLTHPLYSRVYHSHPPLLERLAALGH